jgi:hypothetical protein
VGAEEEIRRVASVHGLFLVYDVRRRPLLLFADEFSMRHISETATRLTLNDTAA